MTNSNEYTLRHVDVEQVLRKTGFQKVEGKEGEWEIAKSHIRLADGSILQGVSSERVHAKVTGRTISVHYDRPKWIKGKIRSHWADVSDSRAMRKLKEIKAYDLKKGLHAMIRR